MFDYTLHEFKCPYCDYEYKTTVGSGTNYRYKNKVYSAVECPCPRCDNSFLYGHVEDGEAKFIKMPEDRSELKFHSSWIS